MTAQENEQTVVHRTFEAELTANGRTVDVRIVPYGQSAIVSDGGPVYREEWMPGVFDHQLNAANRVLANFEHQPGIGGVVGHGVALRSEPDGFHGSFRVHDNSDGDKTLLLINEGIARGVSLEAIPVKHIRSADGVVQRVKANLQAIAFCRKPAFTGAEVLAVREEPHHTVDPALLPVEIDPELVARCQRLGIQIPQRYQAHLAETDTPDPSGTSGSDTRHPENTNTSTEVEPT